MTKTAAPDKPKTVLAWLRAVGSSEVPKDMEGARAGALHEALMLQLHFPHGRVPESLDDLARIVDVDIRLVPELPVPGIAFLRDGRWHLHISAALTPAEQVRRALHELKHVIDHPLRLSTPSAGISPAEYEELADLFADLVINTRMEGGPQ